MICKARNGWHSYPSTTAAICCLTMAAGLATALATACYAAEDAPAHAGKVVWQEDFSDASAPQWSTGYYSPSGTPGKPTIEVKDGNLVFTSDFPEPKEKRGYASASYHFKEGLFGAGFVLAEAPVLELRLRPLKDSRRHTGVMGAGLILNYVTYGGDHMWTGFSPLSEAGGADAGQWVTATYNLYDAPKATGAAGKKLLTDFSFFMFSQLDQGESVAMEVDWIRLRQLNQEEWAKANVWGEVLGEFKMQPCPKAEEFFGLGFYGLSSPLWGGGDEVTMDHMARNWVNFVGHYGGRFYQNVWWGYRWELDHNAQDDIPHDEQTRATYYVKLHQYAAPRLREYGMYYLANMAGMAGGVETIRLEDRDKELMERWADEITSGLRDEENILGWFCADEATPTYLKNYLVTKALLESRDRSKAAMVLVNNLGFLKTAYEPSHQVIFADSYPVLRPHRDNPWHILKWMKDVSEVSGDKPHWLTLQSFSSSDERWYARPSPTELTLMSWLSIAGGANVNCYFVYCGGGWWRSRYLINKPRGGFWACVDSYGNETPWFEAYKEFADRVGPIGPLLAKAKLILKPSVEAIAPEIQLNGFKPGGGKLGTAGAVYVGVLEPGQIGGQVLVAVNMDRDNPQPVKISVGGDLGGKRLYDLVSLEEIPATDPGVFAAGTLAPGDGHPYVLCSGTVFEKVREIVYAARAKQAIRVAGLDLRMARAWQIAVGKFQEELAEAEESLASGQGQGALDRATRLSDAITARLQADQTYRSCREAITGVKKKLGRISVMLNVAAHEDKDTPQLRDLAKEVLAVSEEFGRCMNDFYFGRSDGLLDRATALDEKVTPLVPRTSEITGVEVDYWPFPERPWLQDG